MKTDGCLGDCLKKILYGVPSAEILSLNQWTISGPDSEREERKLIEKQIMDVIENNTAELIFGDDITISSVSSLPNIPECVSRLHIGLHGLMELPKLPSNLEELEIKFAHLNSISSLPQTLSTLSLRYLPNLNQLNEIPSGLKKLEISGCDSLPLPTILPHFLEELLLSSNSHKKWDVESLPHTLNNLWLYYVDISLEVLRKHENLKMNDFYLNATLDFNLGDVVYGLADSRIPVVMPLTKIYDKKDILIQNTLTDAVWDRFSPETLHEDETIAQKLRDVKRGIAFRDFIVGHKKYNITSKSPEYDYYYDNNKYWMRASKAGLEFQAMIRKRKVIFCIDTLINCISDIATKSDRYGCSITASELRWLYRHREDTDIKNNVTFYLNGKPVSQEYVFSHDDWRKYSPKSQPTELAS